MLVSEWGVRTRLWSPPRMTQFIVTVSQDSTFMFCRSTIVHMLYSSSKLLRTVKALVDSIHLRVDSNVIFKEATPWGRNLDSVPIHCHLTGWFCHQQLLSPGNHKGFLRRSNPPKVLIHQTFRQLTAAFISGSGLQSVCVLNVWGWQLMMCEIKNK